MMAGVIKLSISDGSSNRDQEKDYGEWVNSLFSLFCLDVFMWNGTEILTFYHKRRLTAFPKKFSFVADDEGYHSCVVTGQEQ